MHQRSIITCFLGLIVLLCHAAFTENIIFNGVAARTLFICDEKAEIDCWYANGKNFCAIAINGQPELQPETPNQLIVRGRLAYTMYRIIRTCYDDDWPSLRTWLGKEGITCSWKDSRFACELSIDEIKAPN